MGSVLFGVRSYRAGGQVKAVSLRPLAPAKGAILVQTADGSLWRCAKVGVGTDELLLETSMPTPERVPWREVLRISRDDRGGK